MLLPSTDIKQILLLLYFHIYNLHDFHLVHNHQYICIRFCPDILFSMSFLLFKVSTSLFVYAFTAYDSRWLYRLAAQSIDSKRFASIFGGGGEKRMKAAQPIRPPSNHLICLKNRILSLTVLFFFLFDF